MVEIRELKSSDIFPMVGILNKIGFKELKTILTPDKVKDMMKTFSSDGKDENENKDDSGVDNTTVLGFNMILEVAGLVMGNLPSCEQELNRFIANVTNLSVKQVSDLPMSEYAEIIISIVQKQEFKDFFKAVSKLFN